jgi:hypothetical protein
MPEPEIFSKTPRSFFSIFLGIGLVLRKPTITNQEQTGTKAHLDTNRRLTQERPKRMYLYDFIMYIGARRGT